MRNLVKKSLNVLLLGTTALLWAQAQEATLTFVPAQATVNFTLGDLLHTVRGTFNLKSGIVHFNPTTNAISGSIVVDAASGNSGSAARDKKMHKEILHSRNFSEVTFRPDRVAGKVLPEGASTVEVHGSFGIHGAEHEVVVPAQVELAPDGWNLKVHFDVPYVKWGMKDPSTFLLRVEKTVAIDVEAHGTGLWDAPR
jgi:polyisoprenoid-binding protein YceI